MDAAGCLSSHLLAEQVLQRAALVTNTELKCKGIGLWQQLQSQLIVHDQSGDAAAWSFVFARVFGSQYVERYRSLHEADSR